MSGKDKRSNKKRKDEYKDGDEQTEKASKEEFKVAKWIRKNVQVKKTKFLNHNVEYFTSAKALDALMSSKFAQGDHCLFPMRQSAIDYLDMMLTHKFFHRAKKVPVSEMELKGRTKDKPKDQDKDKDKKETDAESSHAEGKLEKVEKAPEKKKRKIRLEMHPQQIFVDGHEAYVWIYDPIPMHYWIFGTLVVIGAIVICLFPLWPPQLRTGVYYLSMTAAGFLVFLLALVVIRFILFCIIWIASGGKHHFWFLPNLTEDVGFLDSFKPLYKHDYRDGNESVKNKKDKKKKKKKESDDEGGAEKSLVPSSDSMKPPAEDSELRQRKKADVATIQNESETEKNDQETKTSESESDSQRSSTGKDFEMLEAEEEEDEEDEP